MPKTERQVESNDIHGNITTTNNNTTIGKALNRRASRYEVASSPFAGRIGGNQEFVVTDQDHDASEVLKKLPDAAPLVSLRHSFNLQGFLVRDTWQMPIIECWGTCLLVALLGGMASGLTAHGISPFAAALYASLCNTLAIALFIFAGAPVSGGHFNSLITMSTFFAGLSTFPRSILYISAQCTGAIVGGYWLRLGLGDAYFPEAVLSTQPGSRLVRFSLEYVFAQALLFTSFGVGLDPRQAKIFGAALSPILVGAILGLCTLASSISRPGYTGISANPARCMRLMIAKNNMQYHYVHWLADVAAAMTNGAFYYFIPPYVSRRGQ